MENKFRYKAWANLELLDLIEKIDQEYHPEQWTMAVRLLNHTHVVDRIFISHLQGQSHPFDATNTKETPSIDVLRKSIQEYDGWLVKYTSELDKDSLKENIEFTFTDGDAGSMSREEILDHLIIHGSYHRGNIGMILTTCGLNRPSDTFTRFLHSHEGARRSRTH